MLLAAGLGTRLNPLTSTWPKCLMPINQRPLLEYWLGILYRQGIQNILVNLHHHSPIVKSFLNQSQFNECVKTVYEPKLLGTAGTLYKNTDFFQDDTILLVHADNWCCCDFADFVSFHHYRRPKDTVITMMTFECPVPTSCGIVELDELVIVIDFHEKVDNPPSNLANAAVYLIEQEVLIWIEEHPDLTDFSTEVLPFFIGRIASWKNNGIHKDIGTIEMLRKAQLDVCDLPPWNIHNKWQRDFMQNPIHKQIASQ